MYGWLTPARITLGCISWYHRHPCRILEYQCEVPGKICTIWPFCFNVSCSILISASAGIRFYRDYPWKPISSRTVSEATRRDTESTRRPHVGYKVLTRAPCDIREGYGMTACAWKDLPANTIHWPNAGLMLARRHRRRPNINPAMGLCIVLRAKCAILLVIISANTRRWTNVGLILEHRLRRWSNIKPALAQCRVITGICM